jgi:hypothetical protein
MQILNGLKRLIYGATTHLTIKQGSTSLRGTSYVELYRELTEYPTTIVSFDIKKESKNKAEFRILADGEKIFPFSLNNEIPDQLVNIIPIDVAADVLLTIEVKGCTQNDGFIVILSELDCIVRK